MGANELNLLINTPSHGGVGVRREGNRFKRFPFAVLRRGTPINGGVNESTPADGAVHWQAESKWQNVAKNSASSRRRLPVADFIIRPCRSFRACWPWRAARIIRSMN